MDKQVGSWQFERSSGFAGNRCTTCMTWVYAERDKVCNCLNALKGKVTVTFIPRKISGNKRANYAIRYLVHSSIYCLSNMRKLRLLSNTNEFDENDLVWRRVFGSVESVRVFVRGGHILTKEIDLSILGYDSCDKAIERDESQWISRYV